jgi:hypothetical protein
VGEKPSTDNNSIEQFLLLKKSNFFFDGVQNRSPLFFHKKTEFYTYSFYLTCEEQLLGAGVIYM